MAGFKEALRSVVVLILFLSFTDAGVIQFIYPKEIGGGGGSVLTFSGNEIDFPLLESDVSANDTEPRILAYLKNEKTAVTTTYPVIPLTMHVDGCTRTQVTFITPKVPLGRYKPIVSIDGELQSVKYNAGVIHVTKTKAAIINEFDPIALAKGDIVNASGFIITKFTDSTMSSEESTNGEIVKITRAYLGGDLCDMYDEDGNTIGIGLKNPESKAGWLMCKARSQNVGCSGDFSFIIQEYGRNRNDGSTEWLSATGQVCTVQIYAEITDLGFHFGSVVGGSRLVLRGSNLDASQDDHPLEVYVGDQRCEVESVSSEELVVITPPAPAPLDHNAGSRGIRLEVGPGDKSTENSLSEEHFTNSSIVEQVKYVIKDGYGLGKFTFYYIPTSDGYHNFYLYGLCNGQLWISLSESDAGDEMISMDPAMKRQLIDLFVVRGKAGKKKRKRRRRGVRTNDQFSLTASHRTGELNLVKGNRYYMEVGFQCNEEQSVQMAVFKRESPVNNKQFAPAIDEVQSVQISSTVGNQRQSLSLANYAYSSGENYKVRVTILSTDETYFNLCAAQACTAPLHTDAAAEDIARELSDFPFIPDDGVSVEQDMDTFIVEFTSDLGRYFNLICEGACSVSEMQAGRPSGSDRVVLRIGENRVTQPISTSASAEQVKQAISKAMTNKCPAVIGNSIDVFYNQEYEVGDSRCGRKTTDKSFCGKQSLNGCADLYKNTQPAVPVHIYKYICMAYFGDINNYVKITYKPGRSRRVKTLKVYNPEIVKVSTKWRYSCTDLYTTLKRKHPSDEDFTLTSAKFHPLRELEMNYIDSVTFRKFDITKDNRELHGPLTGEIIQSMVTPAEFDFEFFDVEKTSRNEYVLITKPAGCHAMDFIVAANDPDDLTTAASVTSEGSQLSGTFTLIYEDNVIDNLAADITAEDLKDEIKDRSNIGKVGVTRSGTCDGYTYTITFKQQPGALPLIRIESQLRGTNVTVNVRRDTKGGVLYDPVSGDVTALHYEDMQVRALVNGIPARCDDCSFSYHEEYTPEVTALSTTDGSRGSEFVISMTGADTDVLSNNLVLIGDSVCEVTAATAESITVTVGVTAVGEHPLIVRIIGKGNARVESPLTFTVHSAAPAIEPSVGSLGGFYEVTITGTGFNEETTVAIGDESCDVTDDVTYGVLHCIAPAMAAGTYDVVVSVDDDQYHLEFTYDASISAIITNVERQFVSAEGGDVIVVEGTGFGDVWITSEQSMVGGVVAGKQDHNDEMVKIISPPLASGTYDVQLYIEGKGFAVFADATFPTVEVVFYATDAQPDRCSTYGGCHLTITGQGLLARNKEDFDISVGGKPCDVRSDSLNTEDTITCFLGDTSQIHEITNSGSHPDYGEGFKWSPRVIEIEENDVVMWKWKAPLHVTQAVYTVLETRALNSPSRRNGFVGGAPSSAGSYARRFLDAGTYFFDSGPSYNQYRFYGKIIVHPKVLTAGEISVGINGVNACTDDNSSRRRRSVCDFGPDCNPVTTNGLSVSLMPCVAAIIDSVSPLHGTSNTDIEIRGRNFQSDSSCMEIMIGDYQCDLVGNMETVDGEDIVHCNIDTTPDNLPPMPTQYYSININQGGYGNSLFNSVENRSFYLRALISDITPRQGSIMGGTLVTITGEGFLEGETQVTVGDMECDVRDVVYTRIVCKTNGAARGSQEVQVISAGTAAMCEASSCIFETNEDITPSLTSIQPSTFTGGQTITINGANFGTEIADIRVKIDQEDCEISSVTDTAVECFLAGLATGRIPLTIHRNNIGWSSGDVEVRSIYSVAPVISPREGSIGGGTIVTVTGNGFIPSRLRIRVNKQVSVTPISINSREIIFAMPPLQTPGNKWMTVGQDGQDATPLRLNAKTNMTPMVTSITPNSGVPGTTVTITGSVLSGQRTILIGGVECVEDGQSNSDTSITCVTGEHAAGNTRVKVYVHPLGNNLQSVNFRYLVELDSIEPQQGGFGGGLVLTLNGGGLGNSDAISVKICGQRCENLRGNSEQSTCIIPAFESDEDQVECDVRVKSGDVSASQTFTYTRPLTPVVSGVSPRTGGTGGGTYVTIMGINFGFSEADVTVTMGDVPCMLRSVADVQIVCETAGAADTDSMTVHVQVSRVAYGDSIEEFYDSAIFRFSNLWSSRFTWGISGKKPVNGDMVIVPEGQSVVLDIDTPILKMLNVNGGTFSFDNKDVILRAENILITNGGLFQIGTEEEPYINNGVIEMYGRLRAPEIPIYGAKTLAVREGRLELHGRPVGHTWTVLDATAESGASQITLQASVEDWGVGSELIIATTGRLNSQRENEKRIITGFSDDGYVVELNEPLQYTHIGITETYGTTDIELRAEVGLLSRNLKFVGKGDPAWEEVIPACPNGFANDQFAKHQCAQGRYGTEMGSDEFGAAIMGYNPDMDSQKVVMRIENIELTYVGQAYRMGRYPVHFHMNGNMSLSYVKSTTIHRSFNRAVNIHNSHNILVQNNVIYDVKGGAVFLEDSIETGNILEYNLLIFVKTSSSLRTDDITPAAFWITHPSNIIRHNNVAGGTHFGIWYRMLEHPEGPSHTLSICPQHAPLTQFYNNTVHSCGWYGLWIHEHYYPKAGGGCNSKQNEPAVFRRLVAWHNKRGGEVTGGGAIQFRDFVVAANEKAEIETLHVRGIPSGQFRDTGAVVGDSVLIARLQTPIYRQACRSQGVVLPFSANIYYTNLQFYQYTHPVRKNRCAAIGMVKITCKCSKNCGGLRYEFEGIEYFDTDNRAFTEWEHQWVLVDRDGSLTEGEPDSKVVASSDLYDPNKCSESEQFSGLVPASVCDSSARFARLAFNNIYPNSLEMKAMKFSTSFGASRVPFRGQAVGFLHGWFALLPTGMTTTMQANMTSLTDMTYNGAVQDLERGDYLIVGHKIPRRPVFKSLYVGGRLSLSTPNRLNRRSRTGDWNLRSVRNGFTYEYIVNDAPRDRDYTARVWNVTLEASQCTDLSNCQTRVVHRDEEEEEEIVFIDADWHVESSWQNAGLHWLDSNNTEHSSIPPEGASVVIPENIHMHITQDSLPYLKQIEIFGILEIDSDANRNLVINATHIYVAGKFIAGSLESSFQGKLTINLHGSPRDPIYPIVNPPVSDGVSMGAKAIGVYGDLFFQGRRHEHVWVKLTADAPAGSSRLELSESVDWESGMEVVITPTSLGYREAERRIISEVTDSGRTIVLTEPLEYLHISQSETLNNGMTYSNKAEVGLLSRNIRIVSEESDEHYGGRVVVGMRTVQSDDGIYSTLRGSANISFVEFENMGQRGYTEHDDPRFSIAFVSTLQASDSRPAVVDGCAFNVGYNTHVGAFDAEGVTINNNVMYMSWKQAVVFAGRHDLTNNLITRCQTDGYRDYHGCVDLLEAASASVVRGNTVAGFDRGGLDTVGESCSASETYVANGWGDNVFRSGMFGVKVMKHTCDTQEGCLLIRGVTVGKMTNFAFYYNDKCNLEIVDLTLFDNTMGLSIFVSAPDIAEHEFANKFISIDNALFVGQSPWTDCDTVKIDMFSEDMNNVGTSRPLIEKIAHEQGRRIGYGFSGMLDPNFISTPLMTPAKAMFAAKAYPAIGGLTTMRGVTAAHYGIGCGGERNYFLRNNPESPDIAHPIDISGFYSQDVDRTSLLLIGYPNTHYITGGACGDLECDSEKKVLLHDIDGTFTGTIDSWIVPNANYSWDNPRETVRGVGDFRIPAVMQTTPEGERIPMDEVRPFVGIDIPFDAQFVPSWPGYIVTGREYVLVAFESLDEDFKTRRPGPAAFRSSAGFLDISNGPHGYQLCDGYPCNYRVATYYALCVVGESYDVYYTGDPPAKLRIHLINARQNQFIDFSIYFAQRQRMDVYVGGEYVLPLNGRRDGDNIAYNRPPMDQPHYYKTIFDNLDQKIQGVHFYDEHSRTMTITVKGPQNVVIAQTEVAMIQIGMEMMTEDEFFEAELVTRLAELLGVPLANVRVVEAINENLVRDRRASDSSNSNSGSQSGNGKLVVFIEIGEQPPKTTSTAQTNNGPSTQQETFVSQNQESASNANIVKSMDLLKTMFEDGSLADAINAQVLKLDVMPSHVEDAESKVYKRTDVQCESEEEVVTLSCPPNEMIRIHEVLWGRDDMYTCPSTEVSGDSPADCSADVMDIVQAICNMRGNCTLEPSEAFMGSNPCGQHPNYLKASYECVDGAFELLGAEFDPKAPDELEVDYNKLVIPDTSMVVESLAGTLEGWKVITNNTNSMTFSVWLPELSGELKFIGSSYFEPEYAGFHTVLLETPIEVAQGYTIGISWDGLPAVSRMLHTCEADETRIIKMSMPTGLGVGQLLQPVTTEQCGSYAVEAIIVPDL